MNFGEFSEFALRNRRPITLNYIREKHVATYKCVCVCNFHVPCGIETTTKDTQTSWVNKYCDTFTPV